MKRPPVLVLAAVALIVGAAAAAAVLRGSGDKLAFETDTSVTKNNSHYGVHYTVGYPILDTRGRTSVDLRGFRLVGLPSGLVHDATFAVDGCKPTGDEDLGRSHIGSMTGYLTRVLPHVAARTVAGTRVPAESSCWYVAVVVHAERPSTYTVPAAEVGYSDRLPWRTRWQRIPHAFTLDAQAPAPDPRCRIASCAADPAR